MKTIKELEIEQKLIKSEDLDQVFGNVKGRLEQSKDIIKLIDERLNHMIASNIIEDELLYLKATIQGE